MERPVNPDCALSGTRYCDLLNMHTCDRCTVSGTQDTAEQIKADLDTYESLLPEGGIAQLFLAKGCVFCKGDVRGKRQGYALLDMANPEPKRLQRSLFGKRLTPIGTMVPVQLSICKRCRQRLLWIEYLPVLLPVLFGLSGLAVLLMEPVNDALLAKSAWLPFAVWIGLILLGMLAGRIASALVKRRAEADMYADILEHPVLQQMLDKGWFPVSKDTRIRVIFSKSRRVRGLGTAVPPEEEA